MPCLQHALGASGDSDSNTSLEPSVGKEVFPDTPSKGPVVQLSSCPGIQWLLDFCLGDVPCATVLTGEGSQWKLSVSQGPGLHRWHGNKQQEEGTSSGLPWGGQGVLWCLRAADECGLVTALATYLPRRELFLVAWRCCMKLETSLGLFLQKKNLEGKRDKSVGSEACGVSCFLKLKVLNE